jgi:hypothetical protein
VRFSFEAAFLRIRRKAPGTSNVSFLDKKETIARNNGRSYGHLPCGSGRHIPTRHDHEGFRRLLQAEAGEIEGSRDFFAKRF